MNMWREVVGQETAIQFLQQARTNNKISHSWLFAGPAGAGRSTLAKAFAASLICEKYLGCNSCYNCISVTQNTNPDVTLSATQNTTISIDEIRKLIHKSYEKPINSRFRIIILEDADRMTDRTANVLLKTLEEPAIKTIWILCSPNIADVLPTIRSRTQTVQLKTPEIHQIEQLLVSRDGIETKLAKFTARISQNHIGFARYLALNPAALKRRTDLLHLFPVAKSSAEVISSAATIINLVESATKIDLDNATIREKDIFLRTFGVSRIQDIAPNLRSQLRQNETIQKRRKSRFQRDLLDRATLDICSLYRDVLLRQLIPNADIINIDFESKIVKMAEMFSQQETLRKLDAIYAARNILTTNASPLLTLEKMLFEIW